MKQPKHSGAPNTDHKSTVKRRILDPQQLAPGRRDAGAATANRTAPAAKGASKAVK
jgi:hypothetical protein